MEEGLFGTASLRRYKGHLGSGLVSPRNVMDWYPIGLKACLSYECSLKLDVLRFKYQPAAAQNL